MSSASNKEFVDMKTEAERWLGEHNSKFKLTSYDQSENRLVFSSPDMVSFNIICPSKEESWGVCSDNEGMLIKLQDVMEYLDSRNNLTMDMVLTRISKSLCNLSCDKLSDTTDQQEKSSCSGAAFSGAENDDDFDDDADGDEDDEFDMHCYYGDEDKDAATEAVTQEEQCSDDDVDLETFYTADGSNRVSVQRLVKDLKVANKSGQKFGYEAKPRGNNLFKWDVKLVNIPTDTVLGKDLQKYAIKHKKEPAIHMEMQFPGDYPYSPPFLRVVEPRFRFLTGHVTVGGSICLEMLTKSGWRPCNDIEGILVDVRSIILSDDKASLDPNYPDKPYTESEAREAFNRMVARYGWNK